MGDLMHHFRTLCVGLVFATFCLPAYSIDPITLLLLRVIRDKVISAGIENAVERATLRQSTPELQRAPRGVPKGGIDDGQLRQIIDEGFVHLSSSQRNEVYSSVRLIIADPKNAAEVPVIIAELAFKASGARQAYEQLNTLSSSQKRRVVAEAREEYEKMPTEAREQMLSALRQRVAPLPVDLAEMILAELNRVPAQIISPPPVPAVAPLASGPGVVLMGASPTDEK